MQSYLCVSQLCLVFHISISFFSLIKQKIFFKLNIFPYSDSPGCVVPFTSRWQHCHIAKPDNLINVVNPKNYSLKCNLNKSDHEIMWLLEMVQRVNLADLEINLVNLPLLPLIWGRVAAGAEAETARLSWLDSPPPAPFRQLVFARPKAGDRRWGWEWINL